MLKSINLALSCSCGANCIYCPDNRGTRIKQKNMPFEYVKKIIDEISSEEFKEKHDVKRIEVGENGDAFLNKDIIKILRYIKSNLPHASVEIFTNFQYFTEDKAEIILKEKLIDRIGCNIDGSTKENYFYVKRLDLDNTMKNLKNFLRIRNDIDSDLGVTVISRSLNRYIQAIYKNFGFYPIKLKDKGLLEIPDDSSLIEEQLKKILDPSKDNFMKGGIKGWAEREKIDTKNLNYKIYSCPNLKRIKTEAFIAPDGTWYACCFDSNNEIVLGNVIEKSIEEIHVSEKRSELIKLLENREFARIGGPCRTVNCCQWVYAKRISRLKVFLAQFLKTFFLGRFMLSMYRLGISLVMRK